MRTAVVSGIDAGVGADDHDVILSVSNGHERLVEDTAGGEDAEGVDDRLHPGGGHTGGNADHVRFLNTAVEDLIREFKFQAARADGVHEVRVEIAELRVFLRHFLDAGTENALAGGLFFFTIIDHFEHGAPLIPFLLSAERYRSRLLLC